MDARRPTNWQVFRPSTGGDGHGGQTVTMEQVAAERGDVRELVGREIPVIGRNIGNNARQGAAEHTHTGYFRRRANIQRNDELRGDGLVLKVLTASPTFPPFQLRVTARSLEVGP
jgi:hypothetical protein